MKDSGQKSKLIDEEIKRLDEVIKQREKQRIKLGEVIKKWPNV